MPKMVQLGHLIKKL